MLNKTESIVLGVVGIVMLVTLPMLAYSAGHKAAMREVAMREIPAAAVKVWTGNIMVANGKRVFGTVYEVADQSGRPVSRYVVERDNPVPNVVKF